MGGRSSRSSRPPLILTALPLPLLLLLLLLPVPAESYEDQVGNLSHFPSDALERLKSGSVSLPPAAFQFDGIANGFQRYPDHMRYRTLTDASLWKCRNRCLAEIRCLGFEHEASSGTCGLTDVLLPTDVTQETDGDWSTGRRRGISWLGQPCHEDSDCVLFARDLKSVECYQTNTCSCREGWTHVNELLCQPNPETTRAQATDHTTERTTEQTTTPAIEQWYTEVSQATDTQATDHTTERATEQTTTPGIEQWYTEVSGRQFRLTDDKFPGSKAALGCLNVGGVQYVPDSKQLVEDLYSALDIGSARIGVGFNDVLEAHRYDAADGSNVATTTLWTEAELDGNDKPDDDCGGLLDGKLHDFECNKEMQHLCEYIGPNLLDGLDAIGSKGKDTWWTYDMGETQQIHTVLYLVEWQPDTLIQTSIYVGHHPTDASEDPSTLCAEQDGKFLASGFARRFTCPKTLTGRYLHVRQITEHNKMRLWTIMAAFGDRNTGKGADA